MPLYVSFLRGINVGGHKKIKMSDLRQFYESLGLGDVRTILQSGNVVFRTDETNLRDVKRRIEAGYSGCFRF